MTDSHYRGLPRYTGPDPDLPTFPRRPLSVVVRERAGTRETGRTGGVAKPPPVQVRTSDQGTNMPERTCRPSAPSDNTAIQACTDPACELHRFDIYSALIGVADAWLDSLPDLDRRDPGVTAKAFVLIAQLAADEVLP